MAEKIYIYDTTLRDGTQGEEISFSVEDKVKIAKHLDRFGVDYIEGGWPGSNPKDMEFFERMKDVKLKRAKLATNAAEIRAIADREGAGGLVIGLPLSLDGSVGPAAQSVRDWALALSAATNLPTAMWDERLSSAQGMSETIESLWQQGRDWLRDAGAEIVDVSLPYSKYGLTTYYIVAPAEASSNLARYDGVRYGLRVAGDDLTELYENTRAAGFGAEVRRRIMIGTYVLSAGYYDAYYLRAQKVRALILKDFIEAFRSVDVLLAPTTPTAAFPQGENMDDPVAMYLNDIFTVPASMAGVPALSVPAGLDPDGLPLGLQIIGRPFDEETVFAVGAALEQAAQFSALPAMRAGA